jgi:hypothetical protein
MTGAEHYAQAEHLLTTAGRADDEHTGRLLAQAQVHATLAAAAALGQAMEGAILRPGSRRDPEEEV